MDNEFVFINGYENLYKINKNGEIYSCWYKKIMKPLLKEDGYLYVALKKEGVRTKGYIHRLLASQFINNPDNKPEVDHIDRNKQNNHISNLRWVTRIENRRNRPDIIENLTEEQKKERLDNLRRYKAEWAEKKRREKGCQIKAEMNKSKEPEYKALYARNRRLNETPEEKEKRLERRRELYHLKKQQNILMSLSEY